MIVKEHQKSNDKDFLQPKVSHQTEDLLISQSQEALTSRLSLGIHGYGVSCGLIMVSLQRDLNRTTSEGPTDRLKRLSFRINAALHLGS